MTNFTCKCKACGGTNTYLTRAPVNHVARIYCEDCKGWVGSCSCGTKFMIKDDPMYTDACCPSCEATRGVGTWGVLKDGSDYTWT